ncbi:MAG: hypothetical protein WCL27_17450, partial [Betaproteobacteria bacterium]
MKRFMVMLLCAQLFQSAVLHAEGVYVTHGENGPVFSDKPQAGSKAVTLQPLNRMPAPKESSVSAPRTFAPTEGTSASPSNAERRKDVAKFNYLSFAIVSPENEGSVIANTGAFEVRLSLDPALQMGDGHAFVVSINGRPLGQRFTSTELMVPPEFWGGMVPVNQFAQIDASVVDGNGTVLIRATPVRFFMRHTTILNNPNYPNHYQPYTHVSPV